jgi:thioester reductase-like protein
MTAASLETTISEVAARCLRSTGTEIDATTPFALLGLDSLTTIELAVALEETLGCELPPELLAECRDVRSLARHIADAEIVGRLPLDDPFERMFADSVLPDDVRPRERPQATATPSLLGARAILLTGATGFLGASLARDLLDRSSATLHCVVRHPAAERLRAHLLAHGVDAARFDSRVRVVEGDLAHPRFGWPEPRLDALAGDVDAICHAGAAVNWVFPYASLRDANVAGTLELLRLACRRGATPFHFISSLSVVYSTAGPRDAGEDFDALSHLRGVHLGYAQTKAVAEALVKQAGARGLPIKIYRPSLISGDSRTGAFNRDDMLSAMVSGCIRMGTAPDLDWKVDCLPVDVAARAIADLSGASGDVIHLPHARPRHWRECVLWMRLYGYDVRLVPYHTWLKQLEREANAGHPLRPLRSFFLERPAGGGGLTLPELYEETRRTQALTTRTVDSCPALDASLLDRYFSAFITARHVPAPPKPQTAGPGPAEAEYNRRFDCDFFTAALNRLVADPNTPALTGGPAREDINVVAVQPLGSGSAHSIVSELTSWRSRGPTGLFRFALTVEDHAGRSVRRVVVKIKPHDIDVIAVGESLAHLCDQNIGNAYARWSGRLGVAGSHLREPALYAQTDPRFTAHAPQVHGLFSCPEHNRPVIVLEEIADAVLIDSADHAGLWKATDIDCAVRGLARLHAVWYGREADLHRAPWLGYVASASHVDEMSDLWSALADHASPAFSSWADPAIAGIQRRLIAECGRWWGWMDTQPRTLIHHDFNPRNICLRGEAHARRLCAYDWELATIGAPQRDLAEFLTFVLPADATRAEVSHWVDRHRTALQCETGVPLDPAAWLDGFRAGLYDLMLNRLPMYALINRVRRQSFLPRVVRTWRRLYQHYPLEHP